MDNVNLTGHFLIAMPAMEDPHFVRSLAYICEHNEKGALGIVINRPLEMKLNDLLGQISVEPTHQSFAEDHVYFGGPVQTDRGFVLHQPVGTWQSTIAVTGDTALTARSGFWSVWVTLVGLLANWSRNWRRMHGSR